MRQRDRRVARVKLDVEMWPFRKAGREKEPTNELLRAVRQSLGIPIKEITKEMGVDRSVVYGLEVSERKKTITLRSLGRMAEAMGCKVVYGVVPIDGGTLEHMAEERLWREVLGSRDEGLGTKGLRDVGRDGGWRALGSGKMAVVQQKLRKAKKASKKAAGNGAEPENGVGPEKPVRGSGVDRLKKAADRQVARKSAELAEVLMDKALEGKLDSARLLVTLAEKKKPPEKPAKKRHGPTLIDLLESEPEWVEPEVGDVWVGNGWRKQGTAEIVREGETREG